MIATPPSFRPWLQILLRPRSTVRTMMDSNLLSGATTLSMLGGIAVVAYFSLSRAPRSVEGLLLLLLAVAGIGSLMGILWLLLGGSVLYALSRRLGGRASIEELRMGMAWAAVPTFFALAQWATITLWPFIGSLISFETPVYNTPALAYLWGMFYLWSFSILLLVVAEVNEFAIWRALMAVLVTFAILILALFLTILLASQAILRVGPLSLEAGPAVWVAMLIAGAILFVLTALRLRNDDDQVDLNETVVDLRGGPLPDLDQVALGRPWQERLLQPIWMRMRNMGLRLAPSDQISRLQRDLILAGRPRNLTVTDFMGLRVLAAAFFGLLGLLFFLPNMPLLQAAVLSPFLFYIGYYIPNSWLKGRIRQRQKLINRALPDALDMLSICVDAGLGFDAAMQRVAFRSDSDLAVELRHVIGEMRVGVSRAEALRHLVERTEVADVATLVALLVQADRLGVAIGDVLRTQSLQVRERRRQHAEEEAHKAPVKMLLPLTFFILPATMLVIMGPALPRFMRLFGGM